MDPMQLLKMHGEKAGVAVVAVVCVWSIYGTLTDPGIRPKGVSQQTMTEQIDFITKEMNSNQAPSLKPPKPYAEEMLARFARSMPRPARISWLMAHPDIGGNGSGIFFYIYDLFPPKVSASDDIGKVILNLALADATLAGDGSGNRRLTSAKEVHWPRDSEKGEIDNHAEITGLQVEMKVGNQPWRPLNQGDVKDGYITRAALDHGTVKFVSDATWQPVWFRARSILVATGFTGDATGDNTILVHDGDTTEPSSWEDLDHAFRNDGAAFLKGYLAPADGDLPAAVTLKKGEHGYVSQWFQPDPVMITAKVRFALEKVTGDPGAEIADFLVSRQYQMTDGNQWLEKPERFHTKVGELLGGWRDVHTPKDPQGYRSHEDLSTPFRLKSVERGKECVWYYEIRAVRTNPPAGAPATARPGHALEFNPRTHQVDVATLENTVTGETIEVAKLEKILRPLGADTIYVPVVHGKEYNELTEFMRSPAGLVQRDMHPPAPQFLDPSDPKGPLAKLHASDRTLAPVATSTVPYLMLSDGRLVWWNDTNNRVFQDPMPDEDTVSRPVATSPHGTPSQPPRPGTRPPPGFTPPARQGAPPWATGGVPGNPSGGPPGANGPTGGGSPPPGGSAPPGYGGPPGSH